MNRNFVPFYVSRAVVASAFSLFVFGPGWQALLWAMVIFSLMLVYLHSGWFSVDIHPRWVGLRRDERGREIQRKALIAAVVVGSVAYLSSSVVIDYLAAGATPGRLAMGTAVVVYFSTQFALLART